ncbi:hypothetical protein [Pseudorhizobium endolithicum]|uniref:hypothetical protein n=1 Tax=Pseudorhizobium endolithicum TaxID=1191678 RepID=UPI00115959F5|nr:hypothetical protein [Pseudorhizobium endolithicum]
MISTSPQLSEQHGELVVRCLAQRQVICHRSDCDQNLFFLPSDGNGARHDVLHCKVDGVLTEQVPVFGITVGWR